MGSMAQLVCTIGKFHLPFSAKFTAARGVLSNKCCLSNWNASISSYEKPRHSPSRTLQAPLFLFSGSCTCESPTNLCLITSFSFLQLLLSEGSRMSEEEFSKPSQIQPAELQMLFFPSTCWMLVASRPTPVWSHKAFTKKVVSRIQALLAKYRQSKRLTIKPWKYINNNFFCAGNHAVADKQWYPLCGHNIMWYPRLSTKHKIVVVSGSTLLLLRQFCLVNWRFCSIHNMAWR